MPSLERFIKVLRLFDEQATTWTVSAMAESLGVPQSTIYRTVRSLLVAGMLEAATEGRYRLGPAFIVFDRVIRLSDPLVEAGRDVLRDVAANAGVPCVTLLSRLYNDTVMCIAEESAAGVSLHTSYERGRPMPLTQGATSKVILANLPRRRLARLLAKMDNEPSNLQRQEAEEFRLELAEIRKRGYCMSRGEIDSDMMGIAAPILWNEFGIVASFSIALPSLHATDKLRNRLIASAMAGASEIENALTEGPASNRQRSKLAMATQ
jgi:DNA-binding IclR family transcriptional regulator